MIEPNTFTAVDRQELGALENQLIRLRGRVINVSSPKADKKMVCITRPMIAPVNNDVLFVDALIPTIDHLWVDVSAITHMKHTIGQHVESVAIVVPYTRKDKSQSYGIKLQHSGYCLEAGWVKQIKIHLAQLAASSESTEDKVMVVDELIKQTKAMLEDKSLVLFTKTTKQVLDFLRVHRSGLMRMASVTGPLNRYGRRHTRAPRARHRQSTTSLGFA